MVELSILRPSQHLVILFVLNNLKHSDDDFNSRQNYAALNLFQKKLIPKEYDSGGYLIQLSGIPKHLVYIVISLSLVKVG